MSVHPRDFYNEYVERAVVLYGINRMEKHLAANAISQMDNLAEVTAIHMLLGSRQMLERGEATVFRNALREREVVLGVIHDAHDSHKHGRLDRSVSKPDPKGASEGQRPEAAKRAGFFLGVSYIGGPPVIYNVLVVRLNDGTEKEVADLLFEAQQAWEREFARLGI